MTFAGQRGKLPAKNDPVHAPVTWRGAHYPDGEAFRDTQFYQSCQALLNSPRLHKMLEQYGL